MKAIRSYQIFILSMLLSMVACAELAIPKPQSFSQKLAVGYSTVTAVRTTATTLLQAKKITADDAQHAQDEADNAREGLDVARSYSKTDAKAADTKLSSVIVVLNALNTYLKGKE